LAVASVTVFVDEAVRGNLPPVCVQTGVPTSTGVHTDVWVGGGLGLLWLLVLAGPLGWLILLVLAVSHIGREKLVVALPYSEAVLAKRRALRSVRDTALGLTFVFIVAFIARFLGVPAIWAVLAGMTLGVSVVTHVRLDWQSVDISLDGSRRWVRLSRVHPVFVEAVNLSVPQEHRLPQS
jgi:hypothetical protein